MPEEKNLLRMHLITSKSLRMPTPRPSAVPNVVTEHCWDSTLALVIARLESEGYKTETIPLPRKFFDLGQEYTVIGRRSRSP